MKTYLKNHKKEKKMMYHHSQLTMHTGIPDSTHESSHTDQTIQNRDEYISSEKVGDKLLKSSRQTWLPWSVVLTELEGSEVDYCRGWTNTVWDCWAVHFTLLSKWCDEEWKAFLCTQADTSARGMQHAMEHCWRQWLRRDILLFTLWIGD